jgi:hypothetical protein
MDLRKIGWEDGTALGSCTMMGFNISGIKPSGFTTN